MVIGLLPTGIITVSAADPVYNGSYTYTRTLSGNLSSQGMQSGVYLLDNATITASTITDAGIRLMNNLGAVNVTLVIKGTVNVQGANGNGAFYPAGAGILVPQGSSLKIVGYEGTTNILNARGGKGGNAGDGSNGASATTDAPGNGGSGGYGGSGGGAAIGTNGGKGEMEGYNCLPAEACGNVNIDTSNLTVNLTGGAAGNGGKGGNGGSSNGWSVIGAAARGGGGGGGGGGAGYAGQSIGTGGQGGYIGSRGGNGGSDGSSPCYAGGGGGGAGGQGSTRGGGGGGGGRALAYAGWGGCFTYSGGLGGDPGYGGSSNSSDGYTASNGNDGNVYNGKGGSTGTISELHLGGAGGSVPSNGSAGGKGNDNNNVSQICTSYKSICFNANGGSASLFSMVITSTVGNFPSSNPTRDDYTFQGWATSKTATTANVSTSTWLSSPATTYYAVWKRNSFDAKVTVNKNGSAWTDVASDQVVLSTSKTDAKAGQKTATPSSGVFTFGEIDPSTTMYVWVKNNAGTYTNVGSVTSSSTSATVNYYDVGLTKGKGIASVTGAGTYLNGESAKISATLSSGYTWDKWSDNNITMTNYSITVNKKYDLTANTTVIPATAPTLSTTGATLTYGYTTGSISVAATPATGHTITGYQWYSCGSDGSGKTKVDGATSASYNIPTGNSVRSYYYVCDVTTTRTDNSQTTTVTTSPATLVTVKKNAITVTMINKSRNYGEENPTLVYSITSGSLGNSDTTAALEVTGATVATKTSNAGIYDITGTSTSKNYDVTINKGTLTINKKTSQATDFNYDLTAKTYNGNPQGVAVTTKTGTGTITVNYEGVNPTSYTKSTTSPTKPGTYKVTIDVKDATNYSDTTNLNLGNLVINKADVGGFLLLCSNNTSTYGDEVTFDAIVSKTGNEATPTGNIVFKNGGTTLGTVALALGVARFKTKDIGAATNTITAEYSGDDNFKTKTSEPLTLVVNPKAVDFTISGQDQVYDGYAKCVSIDNTGTPLTKSDFSIKYYLVNENEGALASTTPVKNAVSPAKYLYVIDFAGTNTNYNIKNKFVVSNTTLPNIENYDNVGYMMIKSQTAQQKPIYFGEGIINKLVGDNKFINTLTNENSSTVTYSSTNTNVATVNSATGEVTILKDGSTTIMAKSTLSGTSDVFASYSLVVTKKQVTITAQDKTHIFGSPWDTSNGSVTYSDGLSASDFSGALKYTTNYTNGGKVGEYQITPSGLTSDKYSIIYKSATLTVNPKTLTASDFNVTASDKFYDGTNKATLNANINSGIYSTNSVKALIEGAFTSANANINSNVNYTITGLTGKDADNYVIAGGSITGTVSAKIEKATVSIICASNTTKTFDGNPQTVDVSAMANGAVFDSSNYTVKYGGKDSASSVGTYPVTVVLSDAVKDNYALQEFTATLTIKEAAQDVFSIEGTPDRVYYGDSFKISSQGANGNVSYKLNDGAPATINNGDLVATGIGTVTITATSAKEGYTDKTATKTFTVYPRVLTPTATATNRVYNAENNVSVSINLENVLASDTITASATGTMANADAGTRKIVYVSSVVLDGAKKDLYTLSETNLQTTVDIDKADVTGFEISAESKKYDGTNVANAKVTNVNGIFDADKNQVGISGSAYFNDESSNTGKTVTYKAEEITGAKAANYKFKDDSLKTATTTADITPINIKFNVGTATFKYDGQPKELVTSGVDELGRVFTDYNVEYWQNDVKLNSIPSEAGDYTAKIVLNNNTNYTTDQTEIPMTIAQIDQEQIAIVGLPSTIEYTDQFSLEAIGGSGTGEVSWTSDNKDVTVDGSGHVQVNGGVNEKITITVTKKDDTNFTEKTAKVVFIPQAKTVNFVLSNLTQVYDANDKEITVTPDVKDATYDVTYDGNSLLLQNAGTYNVLVQAKGNFKGSASAMFTIRKATMHDLKITQNGCTYGETLIDASYDDAPNGANVSVKYSTLDGSKPTKSGTYAVTATYTGDNYETYVASTEFTIEKKQLTVKANNAQRKFGESNPVFTLSYDGFAAGEGLKNLLSEPTAICSANASSPVSEYEIEVKGGQADNYRFNYDNSGKLKVTGAAGKNFYITGANNSVMVGDIFTLHAYYDNVKPKVKWESSDSTVATVDQDGTVRILKMGEATITATVTDTNYENGINATFKLNTSKKMLLLKAEDLVKVYNTERQDIKLVSDDANFVPVLFGDNKNIDIAYTLTTDKTVTEPKQAGTYTVTYSINHPSYIGSGTVTMYINKATATVTARDLTKVYGEQNPGYGITGLIGNDELNADYISRIFSIFKVTSDADATGVKTKVGEYPITLAVKEGRTLNDDVNYNLVISDTKGKLTVTKAPLNIKVSDASRAYSTENVNPKYEYVGFVNNETEADLTQKPVFTYDASIKKETNVGTYADVITASGAESGNYEITYSYTDGSKSNLTVTSLPITVKAGTARSSYLTVELDKPLAGLNKDSFKVTLNGARVEILNVTADSTTSYSLIGSFKIGSEYSVVLTANPNYTVSGSPVSITPISSGGGSGGSIGGGGSVSSSTYTISVTQGKNGKISPDSVQVDKNGHKDFTITPNKGYKIKDVLVDGKSVGAVESYTFESVTANARITAVFEKVEEKPTEPSKWTNPFNDVDDRDWFYDAVKYVNENKLMGGTETDEFAPNANITRGMFVMVLYRMENEPTTELSSFYDVRADEYYAKAVGWASSNGIVKGISKTGFAPNENITREQMAAIVLRYAKFKGIDVSATGNTSYTDNGSISDYAKEAISWASEKGIMQGNTDGSFAPADNSTRAQAAAVFMRIFEKLK